MKFEVNCFKMNNMAGKTQKLLGKLDLSQSFIYELNICLNKRKWRKHKNCFLEIVFYHIPECHT